MNPSFIAYRVIKILKKSHELYVYVHHKPHTLVHAVTQLFSKEWTQAEGTWEQGAEEDI